MAPLLNKKPMVLPWLFTSIRYPSPVNSVSQISFSLHPHHDQSWLKQHHLPVSQQVSPPPDLPLSCPILYCSSSDFKRSKCDQFTFLLQTFPWLLDAVQTTWFTCSATIGPCLPLHTPLVPIPFCILVFPNTVKLSLALWAFNTSDCHCQDISCFI